MMKTALITGASGGIGRAFTDIFANEGYQVVLASRNESKLLEVEQQLKERYGASTLSVPVDLAHSSGPQQLFEAVKRRGIEVDVLVNNAGIGSFGYLHQQNPALELNMLQLNVTSLSHLMMLFLPDMIKRKNGHILNIGSTTSFYPCPLSANYSASKAFVLSLTEAAANELQGTGVQVTALCPGATSTAFFKSAQMDRQKVSDPDAVMDPAKVARIGFDALMGGKTVVVPGIQNWLFTQAPRFFPRKLVTSITRRVLEQPLSFKTEIEG
ncbi:SDR family NAD(P)-dependent oxidoreductase [Paenibacillus sp. GCM10027627]|uniref:SDR family NAD(P)-dependent oxidoreductase n=1 Tax=unclassified Paenibacillus TaxID=185978 RepID=UPI00362F39DF